MEKSLKNNENSEIESLLKIITNVLFNMRNSLDERKLHSFFDKLRQVMAMRANKARVANDNGNFDKVNRVIDAYERMILEKGGIQEIKNSGMSQKEFIDAHREYILGDHKRKYNMSDLYNGGLITKSNKWSLSKNVMLKPNDFGVEYSYTDNAGNKVTITDLGTLDFQEWNNLKNNLNYYRVQRNGKNGLEYDYNVLTSALNPKEMSSNIPYRNAVLNELLSENNITLSNCGDYIGKIEYRPRKDVEDIIGKEKQNKNEYEYRVNNSYVLVYDATELSAAIEYRKREDRINESIAKANKEKQQQKTKNESSNSINQKPYGKSYEGISGR